MSGEGVIALTKYRVVFTRSMSQWAAVELDAPNEEVARHDAEYAYNSGVLDLDWEYDTSSDGVALVEQVK